MLGVTSIPVLAVSADITSNTSESYFSMKLNPSQSFDPLSLKFTDAVNSSPLCKLLFDTSANTGMLVTPNTGVIGEVNYFAMGSQALSYEGSLITVKFKVKDNAVGG
mgnify:CR=1 FL=1